MRRMRATYLLLLVGIVHITQSYPVTLSCDTLLVRSVDTARVHPALPPYYFRFLTAEARDGGWPPFDSSQIQIFARLDSLPFQVIQDTVDGIFGFSLVDANFDGYLDLQLDRPMTPSGNNTPSDFWLFNPRTRLFEKNFEFSNFCNVDVDSSRHLILDAVNWGDRRFCSYKRAFRVGNSHLRLIHEDYSDCDSSYSTSLVADSLVLVNRLTKFAMKDSLGHPYTLFIYEDFIDGQLCVTKKAAIRYLDANADPNLAVYDGQDCYGLYEILYEEHIAPPHKKH